MPGYGEDGLYSFSSRPVTPREKTGNLLVKFQAVSRTHKTLVHHYIRVNSKDRLSHVRRSINIHFKDYFERGFIFLSKTKEVLKSDEKQTTILDILPKVPHGKPSEKFRYPDAEYKRVGHLGNVADITSYKYGLSFLFNIFFFSFLGVTYIRWQALHCNVRMRCFPVRKE